MIPYSQHLDPTPLTAVRFLVEFVQTDLSTSSRVQWGSMADQLSQLGDAPERRRSRVYFATPPITRAQIAEIQTKLRTVLMALTASNTDPSHVSLELTLQLSVYRQRKTPQTLEPDVYVWVGGRTVDRIVYRAVRLVEGLGLNRVRRCAAPDCGRLFFKETRKEYCSTRCQSRIYMRETRKRDRLDRPPKTRRRKRRTDGRRT